MHPVDESYGIRNKFFVPSPSRPAIEVPVHVENHHIDRHIICAHIINQTYEILLCIGLILAIPITQHIKRRKRLPASYLNIVTDSLFILMAIAHKIPVQSLLIYRFCHPVYTVHVLLESEGSGTIATFAGRRFVNNSPASTGNNTIFKVRTLIVTAGRVESALGTFQIQCIFLTWIPRHGSVVNL